MQTRYRRLLSSTIRSLTLAVACFLPIQPIESSDSGALPFKGAMASREVIVAKEKEELDALKRGDLKTFSDLLADDAVFVDAHGPATKEEVVKNTSSFRLNEYSMENIRFVPLSIESGLISYKVTEKGTSHGREFAARVYVTALWVKRDGNWVCLFSQETETK